MGGRGPAGRLLANAGRSLSGDRPNAILLAATAVVFAVALSGIGLGSELSNHPNGGLALRHISASPSETPAQFLRVVAGEHALTLPPAVELRSGSAPASSGGPYVIDTLVLFNNTLVPGNFLAANGVAPYAVAYDSGKGEVFVANAYSDNVSVISDATNTVVATAVVGSYPQGVAYDSGKGEVFVANSGSNNVSVISGATNTVVATVAVENYPQGVAYDGGKGEVFVTNPGSDNVSVISDATNTVVATVAVQNYPQGVAYDSGKGEVFVADPGSENVSVISDATNTVVATVAVGSYPQGVAYDGGKGEVFVTNQFPSTVSVISDASNTVVATVAVGSNPEAVAYDPANGYIYVSNFGQGTISIISPGAAWYAVTFTEVGLLSGTSWWMTLNGTSESSTSPSITFGEPNGTYAFTVGAVARYTESPSSGFLTVNGADVTEAATFTLATYPVTFTETGLPSGTTWSVTLGGSTQFSSTSSMMFDESNGTYSFGVGTVTGYTISPASGIVVVAGAPVVEGVSFGLPAGPKSYTVTFTETGLPSGTTWSITLGASAQFSATDSIVFTDPNGSYSFGVGTVAGYGVAPGDGTVTVSGANVSRSVSFGPTAGPTFFGFSTGELGALILGIAITAIAAIAFAATAMVVTIRSKRAEGARSPPAPPSPP